MGWFLFLKLESLKFTTSKEVGDLLSENMFSSCIFYITCFAAWTCGPLILPKGFDTTPTLTTVVQKRQFIFELSLAKIVFTVNKCFLQNPSSGNMGMLLKQHSEG